MSRLTKEIFAPICLEGIVKAPPSKSFAHRLLILAFLKNGETVVENVGDNDDVLATINCLNQLGANITRNSENAYVKGAFCNDNVITKEHKPIVLNVNESGSTYRFLIVLSAVLGKNVQYKLNGRLKERPNDALFALLEEHGITFDKISLTQSGKLEGDEFILDASISSQYITGFMLSLPFLKRNTRLVLKGKIVSSPYIRITEETLKMANIPFKKEGNTYCFEGGCNYNLPKNVRVEGDWSAATFFLASSLLSDGKVKVANLNPNSVQGDKDFALQLINAGGKLIYKDDLHYFLLPQKQALKPIICSLENIIDSAPILGVIASFVENGHSIFRDVERLKLKESDRLSAIMEMLSRAHIKTENKNNELHIYGGKPYGASFNGYKDHRIVMASSILSAFSLNKKGIISDAECVNKSYPNFWRDLSFLGVSIKDV